MKSRRTLTAIICLCNLLGCASVPAPTSGPTATLDVDRLIQDARAKVIAAQQEMARSAELNPPARQLPFVTGGTGERLTLTWKGDATILLARLARNRGLEFKQLGNRCALPVLVDAKDEAFAKVISQVRAQVGLRATVDQTDGALVLIYNRQH